MITYTIDGKTVSYMVTIKETGMPQTGDNTRSGLWLIVMALSSILMFIFTSISRKKLF